MSDRHYVHHEDEVQLAKILKESRPWLEKYGTTLIYALAAVMAVAAVVVFMLRRPPATAQESSQLLVASTPEEFQSVADATPDSRIGTIARLRQAELLLQDAISKMFTDRKSGIESLDQAATTFQRLSERKDIGSSVRERVLVGLARVAETRCDGSDAAVNAAVEAWQDVLKSPDSKMFREIAEDRIKKLPLESSKSFYAWFQQQDPKPGDDLLLPQDGPGKVPDIPMLNIPDFTAPGAPSQSTTPPADSSEPADSSTPSEGTSPADPAPEKPAEEQPAPGEDKPESAEEKPAPSEEKPAPSEEKPAPAESTPEPAEEKPQPAPESPDPAPEKSGE